MNRVLNSVLSAAYRLLAAIRAVGLPGSAGAHAFAITPAGRIILVKLRYAKGWRLPGGSRKRSESPREAVLRELREEIGMTSHGEVEAAWEYPQGSANPRASLLIVRDVQYQPRWSIEVDDITEATLDALPDDTSPGAAGWLRKFSSRLEESSCGGSEHRP